MFHVIIFLSYFTTTQNKNIFLPFKKLTIEFFNESKTIADYIDFNIYTNITMGTPPKKVAHFILKSNYLFTYDTLHLQYHGSSDYNKIQEEIKNSLDIFYYTKNSSSIETINDYFNTYSDILYFNDVTGKEISYRLQFNIFPGAKTEKLNGNIDLYCPIDYDDKYYFYLFKVLKENDVINEYYITFFYGEYNYEDNSNYFNDDYSNILGNLIIGESPHELYPDKYKEDDEIKINGKFALDINEIKFRSNILNYSETDIKINFKFNSDFIKGSEEFKNATDFIFFNELISKNICRIDIVDEHIYISKDTVYSCENSETMREKIKSFPTIYFEIKLYNLTFLFNYKELFKLHHNRLYFLIIFKKTNWEFGELFLRKYTTSFNYDSSSISFYQGQVDEINQKTDIPYPDDRGSDEPIVPNEEKGKDFPVTFVIIIVMGVIIIIAGIVITLLLIKWKKNRKNRANELMDNYEYISQGNVN